MIYYKLYLFYRLQRLYMLMRISRRQGKTKKRSSYSHKKWKLKKGVQRAGVKAKDKVTVILGQVTKTCQ